MNTHDETYLLFSKAYNTKRFEYAGNLVFAILSALGNPKISLDDSWRHKFPALLQFLHQTQFVFDTSETFYDMLATIAKQIGKNPDIDWKTILN